MSRDCTTSGRDAMIQPYVTSVDEMGERGLVFIDGEFSHAIRKNAMLHVDQLDRHSLFRLEQLSSVDAEPDAVAFAESSCPSLPSDDLLYGRVDLVYGSRRLGGHGAGVRGAVAVPLLRQRGRGQSRVGNKRPSGPTPR